MLPVHIRLLDCWIFRDWASGRSVDKEGLISNWSWSKRVPLGPSWTNIPFKKDKVGLQTPPSPQMPYIAYGKDQFKLKIWILFLPWSNCIHNNLKGIIITFKQNLDVIYRPRGCVLKTLSSAGKEVVFYQRKSKLILWIHFFVRNFKNINWEHVEFDEGKSHFLPFLVVYHSLIETGNMTFRTTSSSMNSSEMQYKLYRY